MAHTNETANYDLPQFVGSDKPSWLTDVNQAMTDIDTQMKTNADAAAAASAAAAAADLKADNAANAAAGASSDAAAAQQTANDAYSAANTVSTNLTAFENYFNLSSYTAYDTASQYQITQGGGTLYGGNITVARNTNGTLAKIYGNITVTNASAGACTVKLNVDTGLRPTSAISIGSLGFTVDDASKSLSSMTVKVNTDGTIEFSGSHGSAGTYYFRSLACLIYVKDFGDTPEA